MPWDHPVQIPQETQMRVCATPSKDKNSHPRTRAPSFGYTLGNARVTGTSPSTILGNSKISPSFIQKKKPNQTKKNQNQKKPQPNQQKSVYTNASATTFCINTEQTAPAKANTLSSQIDFSDFNFVGKSEKYQESTRLFKGHMSHKSRRS